MLVLFADRTPVCVIIDTLARLEQNVPLSRQAVALFRQIVVYVEQSLVCLHGFIQFSTHAWVCKNTPDLPGIRAGLMRGTVQPTFCVTVGRQPLPTQQTIPVRLTVQKKD